MDGGGGAGGSMIMVSWSAFGKNYNICFQIKLSGKLICSSGSRVVCNQGHSEVGQKEPKSE